MINFLDAMDREASSDIRHFGVRGMRWGVINKKEARGGVRAGIIRGMKNSSDASSLPDWTLGDRVDRLKKESDYRRLIEERETYAASQAEKIKKAKSEKVMKVVAGVATAVSLTGGILGIVKSLGGHPENIGGNIKDNISEYMRARRQEKQYAGLI